MTKLCAFSILIVASGQASAASSALDLFATYSFNGTNYDYEFTLKLTNTDRSWQPGDGWKWIVFGDAQFQPSEFSSFVLDPGSIVGGPALWTEVRPTHGDHNGPTLYPPLPDAWVPEFLGDTVTWSGKADVAPPSSFLWSALNGPNFEGILFKPIIATPVPEPTTLAALGVGALAVVRRRFNSR